MTKTSAATAQGQGMEKNQVKIDWDRYVDEDEEDEAGGFDMSAVSNGWFGCMSML